MQFFSTLFHLIRSLIVSRLTLSMEILALRQQLAVLNRAVYRPKLRLSIAKSPSLNVFRYLTFLGING